VTVSGDYVKLLQSLDDEQRALVDDAEETARIASEDRPPPLEIICAKCGEWILRGGTVPPFFAITRMRTSDVDGTVHVNRRTIPNIGLDRVGWLLSAPRRRVKDELFFASVVLPWPMPSPQPQVVTLGCGCSRHPLPVIALLDAARKPAQKVRARAGVLR
jgi:hypothetical protein